MFRDEQVSNKILETSKIATKVHVPPQSKEILQFTNWDVKGQNGFQLFHRND